MAWAWTLKLWRRFLTVFYDQVTGRGLGLAAVQGIVRSHRGVLRVWTEVGQGCTFRVLMPAFAQSPAPVEAAPVLAQRTTGEGIILVIDDDEANCRHGGPNG